MASKNPARTLIGGGRPLRVCDWCGIIDDHPRDSGLGYNTPTPAGVAGRVLRELDSRDDIPDAMKAEIEHEVTSQASYCRHPDCCRAAGCPTGACDVLAEQGHGDKRGRDLLPLLQDELAGPIAERTALTAQVGGPVGPSAGFTIPLNAADGQDGDGQ